MMRIPHKLRGRGPAWAILVSWTVACAPLAAVAAPRKLEPAPTRPASPLAPGRPTGAAAQTNLTLPAPDTRTLPAPGEPEFEFGGPLRNANTNLPPSPSLVPVPTPTNAPPAAIASPAPQPSNLASAEEADWITSDAQPDAAAMVRVLPPRDSVLVAGLVVRHMKVAVRNRTSDRVVALRGVRWVHGRGHFDWVKSQPGRSTVTATGAVTLEPGPGNSEIWFEHGLLLPGETLKVSLPVTPQPSGLHEIELSYAVLGDSAHPWRNEVLVPSGDAPSPNLYDRPGDAAVAARAGRGGLGLLRAALETGAPAPDTVRVPYRVGLQLAQGAWLSQLTGGVTLEAALSMVGASPDAGLLAYYIDALPAWFFIDPQTTQARILFREKEQWSAQIIPSMEVAAPDVMCGSPDGSTSALLNPAEFGDLVEVRTPWVGKSYNPGKTYIPPSALRPILQRAAQRSIPIKVVAIDPNGLGFEDLLTLGVQVDVAGRWLSPPMSPAQTPAAPQAAASGRTAMPHAPVAATPVPREP